MTNNQYGFAEGLPINDASPSQVKLNQSTVVLLGGETGGGWIDGEYYGQHPEIALMMSLSTTAL